MNKRRRLAAIGMAAVIGIAAWVGLAEAKRLHPERAYQERWCSAAGGVLEVVLEDGARVDCLTDAYAVEFDFCDKWAESFGQAWLYAAGTGRLPGVVLIFEQPGGDVYLERLRRAAAATGRELQIWTMRPEDLQ